MSFLKSLAKNGMFGVAGLAATHKLDDVARTGVFGIGGALLAGKRHRDTPPAFPGAQMMPKFEDFSDPAQYLAAVQQWATTGLGALQSNPAAAPLAQQQPGMPQRPRGIGGPATGGM